MLTEKTKKYVEEVKGIEKEIFDSIGAADILDMNEREIVILKKLMVLLDNSYDLVVSQAKMLDEINGKLDKLIAKK